ncbi:MAG: beta-lactamase family protein [Proteobacteria bacterium]|nr:beta-lactamase family protein [Pseudomonadota bacterium]
MAGALAPLRRHGIALRHHAAALRIGTDQLSASAFAHAADLIQAAVRKSQVPGIQYVVVDRHCLRFECHAGFADLAAQRPMQADTTMMAFSMSKTLTAVAVLQLVESGSVALDEPIARLVPWQPYGPGVTIRQLLCHTSGIPNPMPLKWVHAAGDPAFDERARLEAILRRHPRLQTPPGTRYAYSNIGYWLLGFVVEAASGESFSAYVTRHLIAKLGGVGVQLGYDIPATGSQARGYLERYSLFGLLKPWLIDRSLVGESAGSWVALRDLCVDGPAFGGLVGNALAFARFLQDQLGEHSVLLGDRTRELMQTQQTAAGRPIPMTPGWHIGSLGQSRYLYKEGGGGGFHCLMRLYSKAGIGTVLMTNATLFNVRRFLDAADAAIAA